MSSYDEILERTASELGYHYISAAKVFCNAEGCLSRVGSQATDFVSIDYGHLSRAGSIYLAQYIEDVLLSSLNPNKHSRN